MNSYILKDWDGNIFISITSEDENKLTEFEQFTHCLAVVKVGDDYLLGWNKWRGRWEIFGGCIEAGETARDCIARECCEELGIQDGDFKYLGMMKFLMMPDYFSSKERIEYGGLFGVSLDDVSIDDIYRQINDRDEIIKLAFYGDVKNKEPIAPIDEKLLEYYKL
ncbi:MAG: NUDIX domain-containing protein [Oscillospiraceae bacterium]|nr:NUDIX domain-containing protein [Oscillospiraceae bacterium]